MEPETLNEIRYELHIEDMLGRREYVIRRIEEVGRFDSREEARQYMIDTTEERRRCDV